MTLKNLRNSIMPGKETRFHKSQANLKNLKEDTEEEEGIKQDQKLIYEEREKAIEEQEEEKERERNKNFQKQLHEIDEIINYLLESGASLAEIESFREKKKQIEKAMLNVMANNRKERLKEIQSIRGFTRQLLINVYRNLKGFEKKAFKLVMNSIGRTVPENARKEIVNTIKNIKNNTKEGRIIEAKIDAREAKAKAEREAPAKTSAQPSLKAPIVYAAKPQNTEKPTQPEKQKPETKEKEDTKFRDKIQEAKIASSNQFTR